MSFVAHVLFIVEGKDGIWTRAWIKSTCRISSPVPYQAGPPFQDAEKGIWTLTPEGHMRLKHACLPFHHLRIVLLYTF